jgi:beta-glucanase (GH16 family)
LDFNNRTQVDHGAWHMKVEARMKSYRPSRLAAAATAAAVLVTAAACASANSSHNDGKTDALTANQAAGQSSAGQSPQPTVQPPLVASISTISPTPSDPATSAKSTPTPETLTPAAATTQGWGSPSYVDNFDGTRLSRDWGVYDHPNDDPPRSASAVKVSGGMLNITGGFIGGRDEGGGLASDINQKYGRWEIRYRVDKGAGYASDVLLWPKDENWPTSGEIDISEIGDSNRNGSPMFVHNGPNNDQLDGEAKGDFSQWHTVAVEWEPDHVAFYVDGVRQSFQVTKSAHPRMIPDLSAMHLALQLDQGCCRNSSTPSKVVMQIDWVKIYPA